MDANKPFEVAYAKVLALAAQAPDKSLVVDFGQAPLSERCGNYQDEARRWVRLHTKPPCRIDATVEIWNRE